MKTFIHKHRVEDARVAQHPEFAKLFEQIPTCKKGTLTDEYRCPLCGDGKCREDWLVGECLEYDVDFNTYLCIPCYYFIWLGGPNALFNAAKGETGNLFRPRIDCELMARFVERFFPNVERKLEGLIRVIMD